MERGIFGSIKHKLSRKESKGASSSPASSRLSRTFSFKSTTSNSQQQQNNPFTSSAPATRRPDRPGMNAFTTPSTEPPPAYSPTPQSSNAAATTATPLNMANASVTPSDDRYAFLSSFDTIFLIDDSGSMAGRSWRETGKALEAITPICTAHDADGIDIFFLNHPDNQYYHNVTLPSTVTEIFSTVRPMGGTPTGQRLNQILKPYLARVIADPDNTKPLNIIVITDGEPSDDVESVIINAAKKLDKCDAPAWQVGIQFFQVGREPGAKEHLKQLDDELAQLAGEDDLRDIVDTVPFTGADDTELTGEGILKVVLGAVNRRLDRKKSKDLYR
ncbi:uncharacterized protein K452DRAFT_234909 [Aplosporella prunicola CBS 121167]|uniref:VWFA domain-containing protein n=1 Tax=Aplosporella prunicola CBS 121167 TaxID=1176127 RepID=A0A6A6B412_9PEZI|nr:uncharacterized protein K452DRAFT_234909 [Aplosporella prunicola CBS 121167]KAF2138113.1 hypothetical protein K452DRAFT_234909 [Aplosporella prunicola CBS 121167]